MCIHRKCVCGRQCPEKHREQFTEFRKWLFLKTRTVFPSKGLLLGLIWDWAWTELDSRAGHWRHHWLCDCWNSNELLAVNRAKETFIPTIFSPAFFPHRFNPKSFYGKGNCCCRLPLFDSLLFTPAFLMKCSFILCFDPVLQLMMILFELFDMMSFSDTCTRPILWNRAMSQIKEKNQVLQHTLVFQCVFLSVFLSQNKDVCIN